MDVNRGVIMRHSGMGGGHNMSVGEIFGLWVSGI